MTLLENSLRLALFGGAALLLAGCPTGDDDDDKCADADPLDENCDGTVDCDEDPSQAECDTSEPVETGIGYWYYVGDVGSADNTTLDNAHYGFGVYGVKEETWICTDTSEYVGGAVAVEPCPECTWAFDVTISPSVTAGDRCADFGFADGDLSTMAWWAGDLTTGLGFADTYVFTGTNQSYDFTNTLFFFYGGETYNGWYWTAYNLPAYDVYSVYGDSTYAQIYKPIIVGSGGSYYQYYTYYYL